MMGKKTKTGRPRLAARIAESLDELRRHFNGEKTGVVVYPPGVPPKLVRAIHKAKAKREKLGLTTTAVAQSLGVPESQVRSIEGCQLGGVTLEVLDGYAKTVGVELRLSVGATAKAR